MVLGVLDSVGLTLNSSTNIQQFYIMAIAEMKINKNKLLGYMKFILYMANF
jgi:hypothetical protein